MSWIGHLWSTKAYAYAPLDAAARGEEREDRERCGLDRRSGAEPEGEGEGEAEQTVVDRRSLRRSVMHFPREQRRSPRVMVGLLVAEFLGTVAALTLFGIAAPNTYRTALWKDGGKNGFNSDPVQILYAMANYRPLPTTPVVWSQFITNWNLGISISSMFILLLKSVLHVMHLFRPWLSLVVHVALTALWAVSIYGQAGPDRMDPEHPSSTPWYLTKSCGVVYTPANANYCKQAKASFAVTVIMLVIFVAHIALAIWSLIPKRGAGHARDSSDLSMTKASPDSYVSHDKSWELHQVPRTPGKTPATPRTQAFNALTANQ